MSLVERAPGWELRTIAGLTDQIDDLKATNADLRKQLGAVRDAEREQVLRERYRFTQGESAVVGLLWLNRRRFLSNDAFMTALYGDRLDEPGAQIIKVWISKIRRKFRLAGADGYIACVYNRGYQLTAAGISGLSDVFGGDA